VFDRRLHSSCAHCPAREPAGSARSWPRSTVTTPFLIPAGDAEECIYGRAGYRPVTEMLHISRPVSAS
jgi:hypothetical protein